MAGTATKAANRNGALNGAYKAVQGIEVDFVADAADASFPEYEINDAGALVAVAVVFDGTTPPNALTVAVNDEDGIDLLGGDGASLSATQRINLSPPAAFTPGVTLALSGNTTNSAAVKIVLYVI